MDRLSPVSLSTMSRLGIDDSLAASEAPIKAAVFGGPTLILVKNSKQPIHDLLDAIDRKSPDGRRRLAKLRRHGPTDVLIDRETGEKTLGGRACCFNISMSKQSLLGRGLELPHDFTCQCGVEWRIENQVRSFEHVR